MSKSVHDPLNDDCPLNDPETACNPVVGGLPCSCSPIKEIFSGCCRVQSTTDDSTKGCRAELHPFEEYGLRSDMAFVVPLVDTAKMIPGDLYDVTIYAAPHE